MWFHTAIGLLLSSIGPSTTPLARNNTRSAIDSFPVGKVIDSIRTTKDSTELYALYLPTAYTAGHTWPVLFVMDPRGRAHVSLDRFREGAERYGYIVLSSYNTISDGPSREPNDRAIDAMLDDAQSRFAVNARRLYLAGFSGTARLGWYYASALPDNVAGLIAVGAGLPEPELLLRRAISGAPTPFAVYHLIGLTDFNYEEVHKLDARLDKFGIRHHLTTFDGGHSWPPPSVCSEALTWMELQAMRDGRQPVDHAWIDSLYSEESKHIDAIAPTDPYDAAIWDERAIEDFSGLHDVSTLRSNADKLNQLESVQRRARQVEMLAAESQAYQEKADAFFAGFRKTHEPSSLDGKRRALDLDALQSRAAQQADTLDALAAGRLLSWVAALTSFYEPRDYIARGDTLSALEMFELAQSVDPKDDALCSQRGQLFTAFAHGKSVPPHLSCVSGHLPIQ
jgi:predicted esterase